MTIESASRLLVTSMGELYDEREASAITMLVMEELTAMPRGLQIIHKAELLSDEKLILFDKYLSELKSGRPVQYVLGKAWFGGMPFYVDENVLVPRPETEELVDWLVRDPMYQNGRFSLLDIGTGSGCIPVLAKKKRPDWEIFALDLSQDALEIAKRNAVNNQTDIRFIQGDIRNKDNWEKIPRVDIIISNPPYIPEKERTALDAHIRDFEPGLALFVPDEDPIIFYKVILEFANRNLSRNGTVFLEIHHDFAREIMEWYDQHGYELELRKDFSGNNRMIRSVKRY